MKELHIVAPLPRDSFEVWKTYIDGMTSKPVHCFLTVKSAQYEDSGDLIIATLDFVEQGEKVSEYLQRRAKTGWRSGAEVGQLLLDVVDAFVQAGDHFDISQLSSEMLYRLDTGEFRIAPFMHDGYEESGRLLDLLQLVISIDAKCTPAARAVLDSVPEKARECTQAELREWLKTQLPLLSTDPSEDQHAAEHVRKCERCGSEVYSDFKVCENCTAMRGDRKMQSSYSAARAQLLEDPDEPAEEIYEDGNCLVCEKPTNRLILKCTVHRFCGFLCRRKYLQILPIGQLDLRYNCMECVAYEEKLTADSPQLHGLVARIAEMKRSLHEGSEQVTIHLKLAMGQLRSMIELKTQEDHSWPNILVPRYIHQSCYLMRCCVCNKNVLVPRWRPEELVQYSEAPFLVMCEWRTHAICSANCWQSLKQSRRCAVCPNSQLKLLLVEHCSENSHPTLEAVKRIPGNECPHSLWRERLPYLSCSHEVCIACLTDQIFEMNRMEYQCRVCFALTDADILRKTVFS